MVERIDGERISSDGLEKELTLGCLREKYEAGTLSPQEVMSTIVKRSIADADMNIWITPPTMDAIQPYLDRLASLSLADAPLWGIPFAIKDNIDLAGIPTTAGCAEYAFTPDEHAGVVERLIAAGAIPIGKTNLDQFATGLVGARSPYGDAHNALRPELISGGSSSGSAVSVARGQVVFSLGTDTAGSGRVPAALNRLVGYKPSLGAWPTKGVVPACASLDCVTVFAHSLADALVVDSVARGIHAEDPWSRNVVRKPASLPARVLLPSGQLGFYGPYAAEYRAAWERAVEQVREVSRREGISIEEVDIELFAQAAAILYEGPWVAERWADIGPFIEANPGVAYPVTEKILRSGAAGEYDAASVFVAMHKLQLYKLEARKLLQDAVLVMPTCGGTWTREQVLADPISTNRNMGRYTNHCNLLDLCAVAVPAGDAAPETPFGITLFAVAEEEGLICGAAELFAAGAESKSSSADSAAAAQTTLVAVCGLHMRGYPLEKQMQGCGARFIREDESAAKYSLVKLPTSPAKPGMIKQQQGGAAILLEIWEMPLEAFGGFTAAIPAPLGIGKVELRDGTEVPGFVCEAYAAEGAEDVTALRSWRNVVPL
ncbi:Allophanate hydrolase [Paenibacillus allorhizoplanae]|uniref:Allophanate hydrolase n=1 Tax=Paenibacillus allorhizoplanae TaxID=2905648 RepID=A0ABM9CY52_9BACL|nr:allophanate hydrolase [Paenibacillus allorhizoplanae]CAH1225943.1 Allophanate hydrolase [Paenibacillus allorhizoplanae]